MSVLTRPLGQTATVTDADRTPPATLDRQYADVYRRHPFYEGQDLVPALRRLLESPEYRRATELS